MTQEAPVVQIQEASPKAGISRAAVAWTILALVVIGIGIAMRIWFYVFNRSMYRDEAALALNIVNRSFAGLFKPLSNDQGAPIGFLTLEKLVVTIMGNSEYSLRLVPLIASILSLPFFYWLCRRFLSPGGTVFALVVLAMGAKQYDYGAATKQYSMDVLATVVLVLLGTYALKSRRWAIAMGIVGTISIWFSHSAVFVLAGVGAMIAMQWMATQPRPDPRPLLISFAAWAVSFGANYFFILRRLSHSNYMQTFWGEAGAFAPVPKSLDAILWYKDTFFQIFESPLSMGFGGVCALVFLLGIGELWRRNKAVAVGVILPVILTLIASGFHKYPFMERLILFICPLLAIFLGAGMEYLFIGQRKPVGIIVLIFLLITPVNKTREYAKRPWMHTDARKMLTMVARNQQPGDTLCIFEYIWYPYEYYKDRLGIQNIPVTCLLQSIDSVDDMRAQIVPMAKGKRVWIIFEDYPDQEQWAKTVLDSMGTKVIEDKPFQDYIACYQLRPGG